MFSAPPARGRRIEIRSMRASSNRSSIALVVSSIVRIRWAAIRCVRRLVARSSSRTITAKSGCAGSLTSSPLHLQARENERPDRLRIVASHFLADVVIVRAIAIPSFGIRIAAETCDGEGAIDVDSFVLVDFDELVEDSLVCATSDRR